MLQIAFGSPRLKLTVGNITLQPYILSDGTAVITKPSLQKALGYDGKSDVWLYDLLGSINKFYPIPGILFEVYERPILFAYANADGSVVEMQGLIPETVEMTCLTITNAKNDGYLSVSQIKHARAAQHLFNYALENNLHEDIAQATGFIFLKETSKKRLQDFITAQNPDSVYNWVKTLPDTLFEQMMLFDHLAWNDFEANKHGLAKQFFEAVFSRLPENLLEQLRTEKPKRRYHSKNGRSNNQQNEALKLFVSELQALLKTANGNWATFIGFLDQVFPQNSLPVPVIPVQRISEPAMGSLDQLLQKGLQVDHILKQHR